MDKKIEIRMKIHIDLLMKIEDSLKPDQTLSERIQELVEKGMMYDARKNVETNLSTT